MALFKQVTHYGPQSGFQYYIQTTYHQEGNPYPTSGGGQPLSNTWGCTKQLSGFEPSEPWPHIIENLIVIVRWITATKALFLNNRILHEFQMYLMSCSQMSMWTPFKFMWSRVILVGWWCPPVTVCFSSEWYNLFEMVVHVCTWQFKAPNSIPLGWVPWLWFVTKRVSDGCLMPNGLFFSENNLHSMRWWCCLLYTRPTNLTASFSASPLKQQSPDKHVVLLGHIILILI